MSFLLLWGQVFGSAKVGQEVAGGGSMFALGAWM